MCSALNPGGAPVSDPAYRSERFRTRRVRDRRSESRPPNRPVAIAQPAPLQVERRIVADGILGGERFVDIDAETRFFIAPQHAVAQFRHSGENFTQRVAENGRLLDAEVPRREIEMHMRSVAHWRRIARSVPRRANAVEIAERGNLSRGTDAADLREMAADEVDEPAA